MYCGNWKLEEDLRLYVSFVGDLKMNQPYFETYSVLHRGNRFLISGHFLHSFIHCCCIRKNIIQFIIQAACKIVEAPSICICLPLQVSSSVLSTLGNHKLRQPRLSVCPHYYYKYRLSYHSKCILIISKWMPFTLLEALYWWGILMYRSEQCRSEQSSNAASFPKDMI